MMVNIFLALSCDLPFKLAYKRACHISDGHTYDESKLIEKLTSEKHPHTCEDYIYTVNIMECECGLIWEDCGLERRSKLTPKQ